MQCHMYMYIINVYIHIYKDMLFFLGEYILIRKTKEVKIVQVSKSTKGDVMVAISSDNEYGST